MLMVKDLMPDLESENRTEKILGEAGKPIINLQPTSDFPLGFFQQLGMHQAQAMQQQQAMQQLQYGQMGGGIPGGVR